MDLGAAAETAVFFLFATVALAGSYGLTIPLLPNYSPALRCE